MATSNASLSRAHHLNLHSVIFGPLLPTIVFSPLTGKKLKQLCLERAKDHQTEVVERQDNLFNSSAIGQKVRKKRDYAIISPPNFQNTELHKISTIPSGHLC